MEGLVSVKVWTNSREFVHLDCFLAHVDGLSVVDLSCTNIECLPKSVTKLGNLSALLLGCCRRLKYVPSLETLKALRRLDLYHTRIRELPQGMEMLANLRYLDTETKDAYNFAIDEILPKLCRLQFLVLPLLLDFSIGPSAISVQNPVGDLELNFPDLGIYIPWLADLYKRTSFSLMDEVEEILGNNRLEDLRWLCSLSESELSKPFCPRNVTGRLFVSLDYDQSMEQQREMTVKHIGYMLDRRFFRGWLMEKGPEAKMRKLALMDVFAIFDHFIAMKLGVHFFLWYAIR
ncbi:hypothetical protein FNV43_RR04054 [Rhamnella rubrinervis]|uniref:Uncharacterized protein n=1 Tax=Rhamnella rubrinervis TaxID=2594499 RepID=A0A8K0HL56_9ROSA|nr:hypothetical protein FNV43_RR04054 [Rhamnella rubrinervis]